VERLGQGLQDVADHALLAPLLKPAMTRLIRRKRPRQILPPRTGTQNPEHAFEHGSSIAPRPALAVRAPRRRLKHRGEDVPLRVSQFHVRRYDARPSAVYETASSPLSYDVPARARLQIREFGGSDNRRPMDWR
jgi:hypothetical protein